MALSWVLKENWEQNQAIPKRSHVNQAPLQRSKRVELTYPLAKVLEKKGPGLYREAASLTFAPTPKPRQGQSRHQAALRQRRLCLSPLTAECCSWKRCTAWGSENRGWPPGMRRRSYRNTLSPTDRMGTELHSPLRRQPATHRATCRQRRDCCLAQSLELVQ